MVLHLDLINTGCLVQNLVLSLLHYYLIIYINNYFTSMPLFLELCACQFGAIGITQPHKEFLARLKELKERFSTKLA
jgi:hypothetical protein